MEGCFTAAAGERATAYDITMCYQVVLGRDPENALVLTNAMTQRVRDLLRGHFLSNEFARYVAEPLAQGSRPRHDTHSRRPSADQLGWLLRQIETDAATQARLRAASDWAEFVGVLSALIRAAIQPSEAKPPPEVAPPEVAPPEVTPASNMQPRLTGAELDLFKSFVGDADSYLEFGSGGITVVAARRVGTRVTSVHSSADWIAGVRRACTEAACRVAPTFVHADIGPVDAWGGPVDPSTRARWPSYHEAIWRRADAAGTDLYMVDGRFRVACVLSILLHGRLDAVIMVHDASRAPYQAIGTVTRKIAGAGDLAVLLPLPAPNRDALAALLDQYRFDER